MKRNGGSNSRTPRTHSGRLVAMLTCCCAASAGLAGHAWAGQIFQERFHDEGSVEEANHCGLAGLTVRHDFAIDGKVRAVPHGRARDPYFLEKIKETVVTTNLANGRSYTFVATVVSRDLTVTDNGDGTLTVLALNTGNAVLYGEDGKAIARNPGQVRIELLVDHGGTPSDPFDDELLALSPPTKGSTGRNDDICAAVIVALG